MGYAIKSKVQYLWKGMFKPYVKQKMKIEKKPNKYRASSKKMLKRFKLRYRDKIRTKEEKIIRLKQFCNSHGSNRNYKEQRSHPCSRLKEIKICEICLKNKAYCNHHIIMVKNGGTNSPYNLIPVCKSCHEEIHPWMKEGYIKPKFFKKKKPKQIKQPKFFISTTNIKDKEIIKNYDNKRELIFKR